MQIIAHGHRRRRNYASRVSVVYFSIVTEHPEWMHSMPILYDNSQYNIRTLRSHAMCVALH